MNQLITKTSTIEEAIEALRNGQGVIVTDNEDRENEGDLIFSAETITNEQMATLIRDCSGIVCLCITDEKRKELGLDMMVKTNNSAYGTAFTVTIEAAEGVTTGVSAADRVTTIKVAIADGATNANIASPGHVFPLVARAGGVLERDGHTEATIDLMKISGFKPAGVLCELTNPDGTMMKADDIEVYAEANDYLVITIDSLKEYIRNN
ncbi:MAG: 3,4-dihydroxy-2-butanone-4-phosphate synthase [Denitrovibrio sp.]|mgnify:CR=1 FL=1|nr:MAG: 3,4-dihydroxy-2-butanone-4-phosphate synthase [Denitrovibrio sp.]